MVAVVAVKAYRQTSDGKGYYTHTIASNIIDLLEKSLHGTSIG